MQTRRFFQFAAILVVLALLLSACAPAAALPLLLPNRPSSPPPHLRRRSQPLPPPARKLTVAGVVFQSDTFMQTVQAGMQAAADEAGAELILGNTENDLAKESSMIDDYITRGVKAILITPISSDGSVAALKKAKDAGITIVCFNTCVSEPGIASGFLVTKNEDLGTTTGVAAAKFITEQARRQGRRRHAQLRPVRGLPAPQGRLHGRDGQAARRHDRRRPGRLDGRQGAARRRGHAPGRPRRSTCCGLPTKAAPSANALAVNSSGLAGKVFVFGTDMNNQMAQMLQSDDNVLQGVTGQAPYQMGYDTFKTAMTVLDGGTVDEVTNTPTIFFGRGMDDMIKQFVDTGGKAIFEVPAAEPSTKPPEAAKDDLRRRRVPERHLHADRAGRHAGRG